MNSTVFQLCVTLILAHLIGDFLLQTSWLAKKKKKSTWIMLLHSLINAVTVYLLLANWMLWLLPLVIFISHFLIDFGKSRFKKDTLGTFLLDQVLHFAVMGMLIAFYLLPKVVTPYWFRVFPNIAQPVITILTAFIFLTFVGGLLIGYFVHPFQDQIREYYKKAKKDPVEGLANGGKMIGWLERLLIFVFVLAGQYAGVGFLITAKSVFRFGELKESENRKEAEYIIIGTFASFLYAIVVSLLTKWALGMM